jgi:hypothetical protein
VAYTASVTLALSATTPRSETTFSYRPFIERYDEYSQLDNTSHDLSLGWSWTASRRTEVDATVGWSQRERQRLLFDEPDLDLVALPRTRFESLRGTFGTRVRSGRHGEIRFQLRHTSSSYDDEAVASDADLLRLTDSSSTGGQVSFDYLLSARKRLGLSVGADRADSGFRGELDTYRASGTYGWTGRGELTVNLRLGAAWTSVRDPGVDPSGDPLPEYDDQTALVGGIDVSGRVSRYVTLTAGVDRDITAGSGVSGAVESLSGFAACDIQLRRYSRLLLTGRYAQRDEVDRVEAAPSADGRAADTSSFRAEWRAALSRSWQLVLSAERFDQDSDSQDEDILTVDYTIYSASVRWAPAAGRR